MCNPVTSQTLPSDTTTPSAQYLKWKLNHSAFWCMVLDRVKICAAIVLSGTRWVCILHYICIFNIYF
ncbi:hypothetical protein XELAEV_18016021mg [Xenopus laevis]|uniref:Uncharacterized protein n=1 Tax=Xenopus laevis TaxID=8355 RepID=A0A974DJ59_XENLA|nr:hypothetical protein XELAEV_18016021mg [Xenopus laevis]